MAFQLIFLNETFCSLIEIPLNLIDNSVSVQGMACRQRGSKLIKR